MKIPLVSFVCFVAVTVQSNNRIRATFYKGGHVKASGVGRAGLLAFRIRGDNNQIVYIGGDNETQTIESDYFAGGLVAQIEGDSNHLEQQGGSISVEAGNDAGDIAAGAAATMDFSSDNSLTQRGCHIKVNGCAVAGAVQRILDSSHIAINQIQCQVEVTGISSATGGFSLSGSPDCPTGWSLPETSCTLCLLQKAYCNRNIQPHPKRSG